MGRLNGVEHQEPTKTVLSSRVTAILEQPPTLLLRGFLRCKSSPYHPTSNPDGIINLGTSENQLCSDLLIPKLESLCSVTPDQLMYFDPNGVPEFREAIAGLLNARARADMPLGKDDVSVTNGCSSAMSAIAYMIGDAGKINGLIRRFLPHNQLICLKNQVEILLQFPLKYIKTT